MQGIGYSKRLVRSKIETLKENARILSKLYRQVKAGLPDGIFSNQKSRFG
jgi:hypothetical protein